MKKDLKAPVKASVAYLICSVLQQGINFITVPIFTRTLDPIDYGVVNVFNAWYGILQIIVTLAPWGGMFNNGMLEFENRRKSFSLSLMQMSIFNSLLCGVVFLLFSKPILNVMTISRTLLIVMVVRFISDSIMNIWIAQQRYDYKYKSVLPVSMITAVLNPILALWAIRYLNGNKAELKIIFSALPVVICSTIIFWVYRFNKANRNDFRFWKYAISLNLPLIPHFVSGAILSASDRIMIAYFCDQVYVGIYGVAYSLASVINVVITAINGSLVPFTYQRLQDKDYASLQKIINVLLFIIALACIVIMLLAPEAICILAPESYYEAIYAVSPVAAGAFFTFLYGVFVNVEYFYKANRNVMYATLIAAMLNVILNLLLLPVAGFIAAAYTTMIGYMVLAILHWFLCNRLVKAYTPGPFLFFSGLIIIAVIITSALYTYDILRFSILGILIIATVYVGIKYRFIQKSFQFFKS